MMAERHSSQLPLKRGAGHSHSGEGTPFFLSLKDLLIKIMIPKDLEGPGSKRPMSTGRAQCVVFTWKLAGSSPVMQTPTHAG